MREPDLRNLGPLADFGFLADLFYDKRYSHTEMTNPDFVALAKSMRVHAIRCDSAADLPAKMKEFMEYDNNKPVVLEARITKNGASEAAWKCSRPLLPRKPSFGLPPPPRFFPASLEASTGLQTDPMIAARARRTCIPHVCSR